MKKRLLVLTIIISAATFSFAQDYTTGIGLRGGFSQGITVKHFISDVSAFEGLLSTKYRGFDVTALYELHHEDVFGVDRLNWYYGAGAHLGLWNGNYVPGATDYHNHLVIGIDGIVGIEYNFPELPINLSLDWKPAFNLIGYTGLWAKGGAISIRYIY